MDKLTIWKFPLAVTDVQVLHVPDGFTVLSVQVQDDVPCLWIRVNPHACMVTVEVLTVGTGHDATATSETEYVDTYQLVDGALVFHTFLRVRGGAKAGQGR